VEIASTVVKLDIFPASALQVKDEEKAKEAEGAVESVLTFEMKVAADLVTTADSRTVADVLRGVIVDTAGTDTATGTGRIGMETVTVATVTRAGEARVAEVAEVANATTSVTGEIADLVMSADLLTR